VELTRARPLPVGFPLTLATDASIPTLQGKEIKITGRIELYRGKPEIKVLSKSQIVEE
jgi:DNA/RNA endonuclease YhcR with UshA esterase domain